MVTWYVHGDLGSDLNSGLTTGMPRQTLPADAALTNGDIINVAGTIRSSTTKSWSTTRGPVITEYVKDDLVLRQWAGQTTNELRGDWQLVQSGWVAATNAWRKTIDAGLTVTRVAYKWDANIDASGRHYGFLVKETVLANVTGATGSIGRFNYNSGTGVLTVYLGGDNPNTSGYPVHVCTDTLDQSAIRVTGVRTAVYDINVSLYPFGSQCYGVTLKNCHDGLISGGTFRDVGTHCVGFYNALAGGVANANNVVSGVTCWGGDPIIGQCIWYTDAALGVITGARVRGSTFHMYRHLGTDGNVLGGLAAMSGFAVNAHCEDGTDVVTDLEADGCDFHEYAGERPQAWVDGGETNVPTPANGFLFSDYGVRADNCRFYNLSLLVSRESVAYRRCRIEIPNIGSGLEPSDHVGAVRLATQTAGGGKALLECCEVIMDGTYAPDFINLLGVANAGQHLYMLNNAFYDRSTQAVPGRIMCTFNSIDTAFMHARGNIFGFAVNSANCQLCFWDSGTAAAKHDFVDNLYFNIQSAKYSWNAAFDTLAEWFATIDTAATAGRNDLSANPFPSPSVNLRPSDAVWSLTRTTSAIVPSSTGIDGVPYNGQYGPYQRPLPHHTMPPPVRAQVAAGQRFARAR